MKVIMAIHPSSLSRLEEMREFLEEEFSGKEKPVFLYFSSKTFGDETVRKELIEPLSRDVPGFKENLIEIRPEGKYHSTFAAYLKSFVGAIEPLMKKIGGAKNVEIVSFGGARDACYEQIAIHAHRALLGTLKRAGKKSVHRTNLQFMWGSLDSGKEPYLPDIPLKRRKFIPRPWKPR